MSVVLTFYKFSKRRNSTLLPNRQTPQMSLPANFKDATSLFAPVFTVNAQSVKDYSYVKRDTQYFFITDIVVLRSNYYEVHCEMDVLATYKSNILDTTAYVVYSSSNYSTDIPDSRISTVGTPTYSISEVDIFPDGVSTTSLGTFIISYVTSMPTYGPTGLLWLTDTSCDLLSESLSSTGFSSWLENFPKQLAHAYDAVLACTYVPFNWAYDTSRPENPIVLGDYNSGVSGRGIIHKSYQASLSIPWKFDDFRNLSPYTSMVIFLPGYGFYELNPADFYGYTNMVIEGWVDGTNGSCVYQIGNCARAVTSLAVPMNFGTIKSNAVDTVFNTLSVAGSIIGASALTEPGLGTVAGIALNSASAYLTSQKRSLGSIGSNGGWATILQNASSNWHTVTLFVIAHDTNQTPNSFISTAGRVCNKVLSLGSLTGYCQTNGASVSTNNSAMSSRVNSLLDGGIYIE